MSQTELAAISTGGSRSANGGVYVHYGCGFTAPQGWRNFDASPTLWFERLPLIGRLYDRNPLRFAKNVEYGDILKGLPLPDASCTGIYASHVLEHLPLEGFRAALARTYALLQPGGIFRVVVPDLAVYVERYAASSDAGAAEEFVRKTALGVESKKPGLASLLTTWLGNARHLWMWDEKALFKELDVVGFVDIRRCKFGDCSDPMFSQVEESDRFIDSVAVECRRGAV